MRKPLLAILSGEYDAIRDEATIAEFWAACVLALMHYRRSGRGFTPRPTTTRGGLFYYLFPNGKV